MAMGGPVLDGDIHLDVEMPHDIEGEFLVGVRPEDMELHEDGPFELDVQIVEELGAQHLMHGELGGQDFSVSVPKHVTATTGPISLGIKPGAVHYFSKETGIRL